MFSNTRVMLREIESAVDELRDRAWRPSDAVLADTLYTLGDALAELDRLMLQLHRELVERHPADAPGFACQLPLPSGEDSAAQTASTRPHAGASGAPSIAGPTAFPVASAPARNV